MNGIGDRIIEARERAGLSQTELAEACGMASTQLSRYELGKSVPRKATLRRLASALNVTEGWLVGGVYSEDQPHRISLNFSEAEIAMLNLAAEGANVTPAEMARRLAIASLDRYTRDIQKLSPAPEPISDIKQRIEALEAAIKAFAASQVDPLKKTP